MHPESSREFMNRMDTAEAREWLRIDAMFDKSLEELHRGEAFDLDAIDEGLTPNHPAGAASDEGPRDLSNDYDRGYNDGVMDEGHVKADWSAERESARQSGFTAGYGRAMYETEAGKRELEALHLRARASGVKRFLGAAITAAVFGVAAVVLGYMRWVGW